ncbi:hypothetical protein DPMN_121560 [Dreissena polymorpha]|uniref:Uncharacterized protein n=1 Tax=Dreissena polymorpha TaxID=45954 RepID=A0A9D4JPM6_DREPO|nr:hypothetical protein DPMN_121560 [Dreissena polymorpha]
MNRGSTGMNRGSTGMNQSSREQPGLHLESIKMFNTSGMNRESAERTGNDWRDTGINWDGTENNRDGNVALLGPILTPEELRQRLGCRRCCPGIHRGSAWV